MELGSDPMAHQFTNHSVARTLRNALYGITDITDVIPQPGCGDSSRERFLGDLKQSLHIRAHPANG